MHPFETCANIQAQSVSYARDRDFASADFQTGETVGRPARRPRLGSGARIHSASTCHSSAVLVGRALFDNPNDNSAPSTTIGDVSIRRRQNSASSGRSAETPDELDGAATNERLAAVFFGCDTFGRLGVHTLENAFIDCRRGISGSVRLSY